MSITEIVIIVAMVAYAIYKQTQVSELKARGRFTLAIVYAVVGICVGGFVMPHGVLAVSLLVGSVALSAFVGLARGRLTRIWVAEDGRLMRQGTAITVALFLGLVAVKFGIGTVEYLAHVRDAGGFGEVMVMIAVMVAAQAEYVYRRGLALVGRSDSTDVDEHALAA